MKPRTVGVEEELLLVDADTGAPRAVSGAVIEFAHESVEIEDDPPPDSTRRTGPVAYTGQAGAAGKIEILGAELQREQLETATSPCTCLAELAEQVRLRRVTAAGAAHAIGAEAVALATSPIGCEPSLTPSSRYLAMAREYGLTADEQLTCGCHVHVHITSAEEGVAVLDRIRPWLPVLLAMSANSPFWQGRDSGYDSYRHEVWNRWPSAGPTEPFGSAAGYRNTVDTMLASGALLDEGMIYFDARLSRRYPTVEVRVADVCLSAGDTVLIAALSRGLVETAARAWRAGEPPAAARTNLLRLAGWRAARSGLDGDLVHPITGRPAPARTVVEALLDYTGPALSEVGDLGTVEELLTGLLDRGTGARLQRAAYHRGGDLAGVVADAVARTIES